MIRTMIRTMIPVCAFAGLAVLVLAGCGSKGVHRYDNSLFRLGSGFAAKQVCTCVFVSKQSEAFCRELTRVSPDIARFKVDHTAKEVRAQALGLGRQVARFENEALGCTLLPK